MPSSMTHTYFGLDTFEKINDNCKDKIQGSMEYFKTFCQGPDVFYFYHLFIGKNAKIVKNIGSHIHKNDTRKFFITLIHYIHDNNLKNNSSVMSFLYGYICHYFLDTVCHPFIFYKTGNFKVKEPATYKYNTLHADMEFFIDRYLIHERERIEPSKYKIHKQFLNVKNMDKDLKDAINYTFSIFDFDTDKEIKFDKIYLDSIGDMKKFFRIFNYDYFGLKKEFYSLIDFFTPKWITKVKSLSYRGDHEKKISYLNLNKDIWVHPCDKRLKYSYSFMELYDIALNKCVDAIEKIDEMFCKNKINDKELRVIFKNLSYATGMECSKNIKMKYFEF